MKLEFLSGRIGVAVSGGMDSMTLLRLLIDAGVKPYVINVEHGIRGDRSKSDSLFVKEFCISHGLEYFFTEVNAPEYAAEHGISLELAARTLRYEFFEKLLDEKKVDVIALAHHADDNAETILMRIFRGTGIRGLKGIADRDKFIRPLLKYTRAEISEYARVHSVPYVEDETNEDTAFTRNFIRNELLPQIKTRYPDVIASFARLAENAAETDAFLQSFVIPATETDFGYLIKDVFAKPVIVQKYSVNQALKLMGAIQDIEFVHLKAILELKDKPNNSSLDLPFGITALKRDCDLYFSYRTDEIFTERKFDENGVFSFRGYAYRFMRANEISRGISADLKKLENCVIRTKNAGDYFHRVNGKNKLLSDFLNDKKLTKTEKNALLVLARKNVVFAIIGLEVAEQAKIDENTKTIIHLIKEKIKK